MTANLLLPGDHAPWFQAPALSGASQYAFQTVAGRHVAMLFLGSARLEACAAALRLALERRRIFDDHKACFFGVTLDQDDAAQGRIAQSLPGIRFFLDYDLAISRLYGADCEGSYDPFWLVLDRRLRVLGRFPVDRGAEALTCVEADIAAIQEETLWAPALLLPNIFEPDFCQELISLYDAHGGRQSGFMRDVNGKTTELHDPVFKQRRDFLIDDEALRKPIVARIRHRLLPSLKRALAYDATRIERYLVACYEAGAGHFRSHRDNTTKGTAHRRFAVTINLNAEDYEGGDLRFPEFGTRRYRAPTGGAVVFSCSLLHEALPVTRGKRYAFLPFLYDEAAARIRAENIKFLAGAEGDPAPAAQAAGG